MLSLELWTPDGTQRYRNIDAEIEDLRFGSMVGIGYSECSFTAKRTPRRYQDDLKPTNKLVVRSGRTVAWSGEIIAPIHQVQDAIATPVECDGLGYRLATRAKVAPFSSGKGSAWMTTNLIGDADLGYASGDIDTGDYDFPYGVDFSPVTYYAEAVDKINKANGYDYGVDENGFYFRPFPTTAAYEVRAEDARYELAYSIEDIENCLFVSYTEDGSLYKYFWYPNSDMVTYAGTPAPDATSAALYRRRDGVLPIQGRSDLTQAVAMAAVALDERKRMRPRSSFVVTRVTSTVTGQVVPLELVGVGELVHIRDLYPTSISSTAARIMNELSTFQIFEASYEVARGELTIAPGTMSLMMEKMLARIESRQEAA